MPVHRSSRATSSIVITLWMGHLPTRQAAAGTLNVPAGLAAVLANGA